MAVLAFDVQDTKETYLGYGRDMFPALLFSLPSIRLNLPGGFGV